MQTGLVVFTLESPFQDIAYFLFIINFLESKEATYNVKILLWSWV